MLLGAMNQALRALEEDCWSCLSLRLERDLVAEDRVYDVAELPGDRHHRDPVALAFSSLLVVEGAEPRIVSVCSLGREVEGTPQVRRPVLRDRSALQLELAGLVHGRVDACVAHDGGGVSEPGDVSDLGDYLGAGRVRHAGNREDQGLDRLQQRGDPGICLGDAREQELDLRDVGLDLEGRGLGAQSEADCGLGPRLDRGSLPGAGPSVGGLGDDPLQRGLAHVRDVFGERALGEHRKRRLAEQVGEDAVVFGEVGVHEAYDVGLHGRNLLF